MLCLANHSCSGSRGRSSRCTWCCKWWCCKAAVANGAASSGLRAIGNGVLAVTAATTAKLVQGDCDKTKK